MELHSPGWKACIFILVVLHPQCKCSFFSPQHLLSPQQAPERLLNLAQKNLDTLVIEMDELLTRVSLASKWQINEF